MLPFSLWLSLSSLLPTAVLASPVQSPFQIAPAFGDHYDSAPLKDSSLKGRFLHITDMHPDPHYRTDSSESTACHRKKPRKEKDRGGYYGLPYGDCDSPFSLTNLTLDFLDKHWAKEIDFVIWTGDTARHDNDREIPRTPDEIYDLNRAVVRRMTEVFTTRGIPVVPSLGNNDVWPHNIMVPGPNSITNEFASIWRSFIPFESYQVFQRGGYYSVEVISNQVAVISLNTMYFYDSNKAVGGCEYTEKSDPGNLQFDWLEVQLHRYRERGIQVWLSGHVPPSPGNYFPGCYVRYADLALRYQDTILGHLFGHMNVDHEDDTILPDEEEGMKVKRRFRGGNREANSPEVGLSAIEMNGHEGLAETLLEEFRSIPKEGKTDLDDYVVINVSPSVVPNPYLPTFRVFAYNVTEVVVGRGSSDDESFLLLRKKKKGKKDKKKKSPKRDHGHKHRKEREVDCKDKKHRNTWACRPRKPQYASGESPSRTNSLWTPLGYAQYWLPGLGNSSKGEKPKYKMEYATFTREMLHPENGDSLPIPLKELPKSLREGRSNGTEKRKSKYLPYGLEDLTIGAWVSLGRRLGESRGRGKKIRSKFVRYMYQGADGE